MPIVGASFRGIPASCRVQKYQCLFIALEVGKQCFSYLQLRERESTACSHSAIIFDSGAANDGLELVNWTRGYCCSF